MTFDMTTEQFAALQSKAETEDEFQSRVIDLAHAFGWYVAHFRPVRTFTAQGQARWMTPVQADGSGFPDLVLVRDRVLFVELKRDNGALDPKQREWRDKLGFAEANWYMWKPRDWTAIERILR